MRKSPHIQAFEPTDKSAEKRTFFTIRLTLVENAKDSLFERALSTLSHFYLKFKYRKMTLPMLLTQQKNVNC